MLRKLKYSRGDLHSQINADSTKAEKSQYCQHDSPLCRAGNWEKPFIREWTHKDDFHVDGSTKVQVDMMMKMDYYHCYEDAGNHASIIVLPYNRNTAMMIVLPDEFWMKTVERNINKDHIRKWQNSASMM